MTEVAPKLVIGRNRNNNRNWNWNWNHIRNRNEEKCVTDEQMGWCGALMSIFLASILVGFVAVTSFHLKQEAVSG